MPQLRGNLEFVTINEDGFIGSLYFENGRIRLTHCAGPLVTAYDSSPFRIVVRENEKAPAIRDAKSQLIRNKIEEAKVELKKYLYEKKTKPSCLIEINPDGTLHPSRGTVDYEHIKVFLPILPQIMEFFDKWMKDPVYMQIRRGVDSYLTIRNEIIYEGKENLRAQAIDLYKKLMADPHLKLITNANDELFKLINSLNPSIPIYPLGMCVIRETQPH